MKIGRALAAGSVFLLLVAACAPPPKTIQVFASPTPSSAPSPTPTDPMAASGPTFHIGEVGLAYTPVALSATGGRAPYKWTVIAGALPGGVTLGNDGRISGTPTASGQFAFTIQVADSGDSSAKIDSKISIAAALSASLVPGCAQYCNVELGCTNVCGNFGGLSGGVEPYSFSLTQGPLPAGTSLSELSLIGTFQGSPGWVQFTVQVSDALGATSTISPKFWMYDHVSLTGGTCRYQPRLPCTINLPTSGGTPGSTTTVKVVGWKGGTCGFTAAYVCPQPPISGSGSGGTVSVTIGPVGANDYPYPGGTFTILVSSSDVCGSGTNCSSTPVSLGLVWTG